MIDQKIDRRVQRTRQLLHDSLIELIFEKGYDKITVQDITDRANVGRSTFYSHYQDKGDLLVGDLRAFGREIGQQFEKASVNEKLLPTTELFRHLQENERLFKALLGGKGIDTLSAAIREHLSETIQMRLEHFLTEGQGMLPPPSAIAIFLTGGLWSLLSWWLDNKMPYSPEEMDEIFQQLTMPGIRKLITS